MLSFENDYSTGAHPRILERFIETNMESQPGYGSDEYTTNAIEYIRETLECPEAQVYLAVGGTQTNQLVIAACLKNYQGVIAANTGHINVHEAGAVEYSGHKILSIPNHMGKIDATELRDYLETFYGDDAHEHMIFPGMVYISQSTEYGSIYSKSELTDIYAICKEYDIPLFIDGARLGYALTCRDSDITFKDLPKLCDVFYIGGTKVGAICGEAIVFTHNNMPEHFLTTAKQHGALAAKGRLLGVQFETLMADKGKLYLENGRKANEMKEKLIRVLKNAGIRFFYESPTNQQFVILQNDRMKKIEEDVRISFWEKYDEDHTVVRFATSWSTTDEDIERLRGIL